MVHVINPTPKDQPQNGVTQLCSTTDACQQTTTQPNPDIFLQMVSLKSSLLVPFVQSTVDDYSAGASTTTQKEITNKDISKTANSVISGPTS